MNGRFLCFAPISYHSPQKSSNIHAIYYLTNRWNIAFSLVGCLFVRRELLPLLSCLLDPCQPRSHVGLVLFVEVAEEEGPGEPLTLKPGQALGIVELLIAQGVDGGDQLLENLV